MNKNNIVFTGRIHLDKSNIIQLFKLSMKLSIKEIKKVCCDYLLKKINLKMFAFFTIYLISLMLKNLDKELKCTLLLVCDPYLIVLIICTHKEHTLKLKTRNKLWTERCKCDWRLGQAQNWGKECFCDEAFFKSSSSFVASCSVKRTERDWAVFYKFSTFNKFIYNIICFKLLTYLENK